VMIPNSGFGADVSAPAVRQIWDDIYGLEGHQAALPGGALPKPPQVSQQGQIERRGHKKTKPAATASGTGGRP
jgi:hypothetical protein